MIKNNKVVPVRMCCGCHKHLAKNQLIKCVKEDNIIVIDKQYNKPGHGAYICKNLKCIEKAKKINALERALKCIVKTNFYDKLKQEYF